MIFEPAERIPLPTKDLLLSFIFDGLQYDRDEPVRLLMFNLLRG